MIVGASAPAAAKASPPALLSTAAFSGESSNSSPQPEAVLTSPSSIQHSANAAAVNTPTSAGRMISVPPILITCGAAM